jgi:hypothetical protein
MMKATEYTFTKVALNVFDQVYKENKEGFYTMVLYSRIRRI